MDDLAAGAGNGTIYVFRMDPLLHLCFSCSQPKGFAVSPQVSNCSTLHPEGNKKAAFRLLLSLDLTLHLGVHGPEKVRVGLGLGQLPLEELHRLHNPHAGQDLPEDPHPVQFFLG